MHVLRLTDQLAAAVRFLNGRRVRNASKVAAINDLAAKFRALTDALQDLDAADLDALSAHLAAVHAAATPPTDASDISKLRAPF